MDERLRAIYEVSTGLEEVRLARPDLERQIDEIQSEIAGACGADLAWARKRWRS